MIKSLDNMIIEEFENTKFKINVFDPNETALVTHYLNDFNNGSSVDYEDSVNHVMGKYVAYKEDVQEVKIVAEVALQQLLIELTGIPFPSPENYKFKFIDLFAGVGGFRLALQEYGGKCVYSSEWDSSAQTTYRTNYGEIPFGDITKTDTKNYIPLDFDVLCAGFPCQAFSIAGQQKGFAETRGTLFFEIEKIIEKHRPKVVFLENVKNLQSHDKGRTFGVIKEILEEKLNYRVSYDVLNSMTHANIPQNRERIFIVAFDPEQVENYSDFEFPKRIELTETIHNVITNEKVDDIYYYKKNHQYYEELDRVMTSRDTVYQWRRVYVRENKSNVCPTLTANMGSGGHNVPLIRDNYGIRKLTPRECFSFQGYPNEFVMPNISNSKLYMQAGNSVTVPLIKRIFENILKVL